MPSPATSERYNPRSRGQDKPCDFCVRSGTFSRLGVQDTQKCPLENRNVAALMLTMPGRVAGDHPFLPRFAAILLQVVSPPVKVGWDTALSAGKIPHVHLVPLNVSYSPRSRGQDKPCDFCVRSGTFSRLGVQDTQKCPLENRNVAALMLTMPGRVAGDHPLLPRFAAILLQVVSPPVKVGWDTALSAGKIPHVHLVPL